MYCDTVHMYYNIIYTYNYNIVYVYVYIYTYLARSGYTVYADKDGKPKDVTSP